MHELTTTLWSRLKSAKPFLVVKSNDNYCTDPSFLRKVVKNSFASTVDFRNTLPSLKSGVFHLLEFLLLIFRLLEVLLGGAGRCWGSLAFFCSFFGRNQPGMSISEVHKKRNERQKVNSFSSFLEYQKSFTAGIKICFQITPCNQKPAISLVKSRTSRWFWDFQIKVHQGDRCFQITTCSQKPVLTCFSSKTSRNEIKSDSFRVKVSRRVYDDFWAS